MLTKLPGGLDGTSIQWITYEINKWKAWNGGVKDYIRKSPPKKMGHVIEKKKKIIRTLSTQENSS